MREAIARENARTAMDWGASGSHAQGRACGRACPYPQHTEVWTGAAGQPICTICHPQPQGA